MLSFEFQVEGTFEDGEFTGSEGNILRTFEKDIKRKMNKLSISRGTYNLTALEVGEVERYFGVNSVTCSHQYFCESQHKNENYDCEQIECTLRIGHDVGTTPEEVQFMVLKASKVFFNLGSHSLVEDQRFAGPYSQNTTISLELSGVPQVLMMEEQMHILENTLADIIVGEYSTPNTWFMVTSMKVEDQSANSDGDLGNGFNNLRSNAFGSLLHLANLSDLKIVLTMLSVHGSEVSRSFDLEVNAFVESIGDDVIYLLQESGNSYFSEWLESGTATLSSTPTTSTGGNQRVAVGGSNNNIVGGGTTVGGQQKGRFAQLQMSLANGIIGIFVSVVGSVSVFILFKKTRPTPLLDRKETSHGGGKEVGSASVKISQERSGSLHVQGSPKMDPIPVRRRSVPVHIYSR